MRNGTILVGLVAILMLALVGGCSNDPASSDGSFVRIIFQDSSPAAKVAAVDGVALTSARVVIGRIELTGPQGEYVVFSTTEHQPMVVDLDLDGTSHRVGYVAVPPGTYNHSMFRIQKLEPTDGDVYTDNIQMQDISLRAAGYVNNITDSTFVFTTTLDEEQNHDFSAITVEPGQTVDLVFHFDHNEWFSDGDGGWIDPREAQIASSRSIVETNIVNSFDVYQQ